MRNIKIPILGGILLITSIVLATGSIVTGCTGWTEDTGTKTMGVIQGKYKDLHYRRYAAPDTTYMISIYIKDQDELMHLGIDRETYESVVSGDSIETIIVNHYKK